uniref:MAP6 domain containing 1 n=1 Tax=Echeneis naucrates TaxID=173247 RepID=A0A665TFX5_ECHNA
MAWPCISRVCCLARFWNQFDKSDLSVPLTIQNYSDISEQEVRSITKQVSASERASGNNYSTAEPITQYKQDFKPWPIPRKENFPWIGNGGSRWGEESKTSSYRYKLLPLLSLHQTMMLPSFYRQEYRPWTGVKPAKSARKNPPAQYSSPGTEATQVPRETSYQAAYSGDMHKSSMGLHQGEQIIPSAASNIQPAAVPQPISSAVLVGGTPVPSNLQQRVPPERAELSGITKGEVSKNRNAVRKMLSSTNPKT